MAAKGKGKDASAVGMTPEGAVAPMAVDLKGAPPTTANLAAPPPAQVPAHPPAPLPGWPGPHPAQHE
eukprot:651561-Pyramimonas_sp.AAC.1